MEGIKGSMTVKPSKSISREQNTTIKVQCEPVLAGADGGAITFMITAALLVAVQGDFCDKPLPISDGETPPTTTNHTGG